MIELLLDQLIWIYKVSLMLINRSYFGESEKLDDPALVTLMEGNRTIFLFNRNVRPFQNFLKNHKRRVAYNKKKLLPVSDPSILRCFFSPYL